MVGRFLCERHPSSGKLAREQQHHISLSQLITCVAVAEHAWKFHLTAVASCECQSSYAGYVILSSS